MESFGERLKVAIKKSDLSQDQLAKLIGVHQNTISGYVKDKMEPGINKVKLMAHYLGCELVWLITGFTAEELALEIQNRELSMIVSEKSPEYRAEQNVDAVNKFLKLTNAHKAIVEVLIDELLKLEGEK